MSVCSTELSREEIPRTPRGVETPAGLPVQYVTVAEWMRMTGMGKTSVYEALAQGGWLKSIKLGAKRLIDVETGLTYLANLPPAPLTTGLNKRSRNGPR
jgi:hypothetical protein